MFRTESNTAARQPDPDPLPLDRAARENGSASATRAATPPTAAQSAEQLDSGLASISLIAGYYRIAADPAQLRHQLALTGRLTEREDLLRAGNLLRLKSRVIRGVDAKRLGAI